MSVIVNYKHALINAGILAGVSFFTTLSGIRIAAPNLDIANVLMASGIAAGLAFFVRLAVEYGLSNTQAAQVVIQTPVVAA